MTTTTTTTNETTKEAKEKARYGNAYSEKRGMQGEYGLRERLA